MWQWTSQCIKPRMSGFTNAMLRLREEIHNRLTVAQGLPTSLHLESKACRGKAGIKAETWYMLPRHREGAITMAVSAQGTFLMLHYLQWWWGPRDGRGLNQLLESPSSSFLSLRAVQSRSALDLSPLLLYFTPDSKLHQDGEALAALLSWCVSSYWNSIKHCLVVA